MVLGTLGMDSLVAVLLVLGGAIALLIAVLAGVGWFFSSAELSPGRRAIGHWLPVAATAVVATLLGHAEMGFGVVFGTSVAAMSAVAGFVMLAGPAGTIPARAGRVWALLPAATTLAFAIGFRGNVGLFEAAVLAIQGVLVLGVWTDWREAGRWVEQAAVEAAPRRGQARGMRVIHITAALVLCVVAAWAATRGAEQLSRLDVRYSTSAIAATFLSVALVMPMIGTGVPPASRACGWSPLTAQVGVVYLNLCLLLPLVIVIARLMAWGGAASTQGPTNMVIFPRLTWRIDALAGVVLSLVFMALSAGRLKTDRQLAGGLVIGYCMYLLCVMAADMRG